QQSGTITSAGEVDTFTFVAPVTGLLTIEQARRPDSTLDSVLAAFTSEGGYRLIAFNDDAGQARDSQARLFVVAGQAYYVQAAGFDSSTGAYDLTFRTEPPAPLPTPLPEAIDLLPDAGRSCGEISNPHDTQLFR